MNRSLRRIAKQAQVAAVTAHAFRRTFASHLIIDQGLDVVRVQRQLGHSRPSVTLDRYSFLFEQARYADDLRASIGGSAYGALLERAAGGGREPSLAFLGADAASQDGEPIIERVSSHLTTTLSP